jgi:hypothetical protein
MSVVGVQAATMYWLELHVEHAVHAEALVAVLKLVPAVQGAHVRSLVLVPAMLVYSPGSHKPHAVQAVAFVDGAKVPVPQPTHTRLAFADGGLASYWPALHVVHAVQIVALVVSVNVPCPQAAQTPLSTNSPGVQPPGEIASAAASADGESPMLSVVSVDAWSAESKLASPDESPSASTTVKPSSPSTVPQPANHIKLG